MRLNEPTSRANTNIVNTLLSDETRHQSGSASLDYKPKSDGKLTTPKPGKRKIQQQQQRTEQKHQRTTNPTRSRERTGLPPKRYDIADIHKMDEYQLMTAIREDPEFAAAMQEYSEQLAKKEREPSPPTTQHTSPPTGARRKTKTKPRERYYRAADGNAQDLAEYPHHVRELMDSGVPVTQWIILLLLLCAGCYQIGKSLMGPRRKSSATIRNKSRGVDKSAKSKQKNKQKTKPDIAKKSKTKVSKTVVTKKPMEAVSDVKSEEVKKITTPTTAPTKIGKTKKGRNNPVPKEQTPRLDDDSTNKSTHEKEGDNKKESGTVVLGSVIPPLVHTEPEDDDGGWETVTKTRKASIEPHAIASENSRDLPNGDSPSPVKEQKHDESLPADNGQNTKKSKKKNKKKVKQVGAAPVKKDTSSATDEDAALALQLQKEEESFIEGGNDHDQEEVWEEVTTKKRSKAH
eukprot:scaffold3840_cov129-Cylindrotheca_fusiformis.AAC.4